VSRSVAFVCAMPMELVPLTKALSLRTGEHGPVPMSVGSIGSRPVVAIVTGMGTSLAAAGVERLLTAVEVEWVVVVGITGALDNETPIGTLVRPEAVVDGSTGDEFRPDPLGSAAPRGKMWTSDSLITDPETLAGLRRDGVVSLDMETAAIAAVSSRHGVPWSVFRAISDRASDGSVDEEVFRLSNQDGTPNSKAVASYLVKHPGRIPAMARMARAARLATERAAEAAIAAVSELDSAPG